MSPVYWTAVIVFPSNADQKCHWQPSSQRVCSCFTPPWRPSQPLSSARVFSPVDATLLSFPRAASLVKCRRHACQSLRRRNRRRRRQAPLLPSTMMTRLFELPMTVLQSLLLLLFKRVSLQTSVFVMERTTIACRRQHDNKCLVLPCKHSLLVDTNSPPGGIFV